MLSTILRTNQKLFLAQYEMSSEEVILVLKKISKNNLSFIKRNSMEVIEITMAFTEAIN